MFGMTKKLIESSLSMFTKYYGKYTWQVWY